MRALAETHPDEIDTRCWLVRTLGDSRDPLVFEPLLQWLNDPDEQIRVTVIEALGRLEDVRAVDPLLQQLDEPSTEICASAATALVQLNDARGLAALYELLIDTSPHKRQVAVEGLVNRRDKTDKWLLSRDVDGSYPWLDPQEPITIARVAEAARKLKLTEEEVRTLYQALAADFLLRLDW